MLWLAWGDCVVLSVDAEMIDAGNWDGTECHQNVLCLGIGCRYSWCMEKNDRSTDAFTLHLINRWETHWMWNDALFLIVCGFILAPFFAVLMVLFWLTFLWMIGRYPKWFFL